MSGTGEKNTLHCHTEDAQEMNEVNDIASCDWVVIILSRRDKMPSNQILFKVTVVHV